MDQGPSSVLYTAEATSSGGGRTGRVSTPDGVLAHDVRMPPALGGPGGGTNPEQLFAAAYASCFHSALRLVAKERGVDVAEDTRVDAAVGIGRDGGAFAISATITAHLPGLDQAEADAVLAAAHEVCPYSRAVRGNVDVALVARVAS